MWSAVTQVFTGVPDQGSDVIATFREHASGAPSDPAETFLTRLPGEVARRPVRLVAACLASVMGPAVVAHAGIAARASRGRPAAEQAVTQVRVPEPEPGDPATWHTAAEAAAATCPGLPAAVLVAMGRVESSLGLQAVPSSAGAEGPMQFLPATWAEYGVDGNGDGRTDVTDPADALHGAARLLCANGGADAQGLRSALWNYNHSDDYVRHVLAVADSGPGGTPGP